MGNTTMAEDSESMTHAQGHEMAGEGDGEDFDDMMEQLLEGERAGDTLLDVVVGRADLTAASMDTEDTINDSQMLSRDDSQYVEGGGEREGGDDDSDTDSSHS